MNNQKLIRSNCLIQAIVVRLTFKNSKIGYDFNSPSGCISFYCDVDGKKRLRFRRKIRRNGNKGKFLFVGYRFIEHI